MKSIKPSESNAQWRQKSYRVIFESDTRAGRIFDAILLWVILISVLVVFLESIQSLKNRYGNLFYILEWCFTILFTIEYIFRLISVRRPLTYAFSFYGIVDLLAILPTYLSFFIEGSQYLLVIRVLRLLRVFRIFKLTHFLSQADLLGKALVASKEKIIVFLLTVLSIVVVIGTIMYVVEGPENGFTNIPISIYWCIVTLTTVGYGDISPQTPLGQFLASLVMITGYAIIAVPTGIVTVELAETVRRGGRNTYCPNCKRDGHDADAVYCKYCSSKL